jgi:hypothetical protein
MRRKLKRRWRNIRALWKNRQVLASVVRSHVFFLENRSLTVWGGISEFDEIGIREAVSRAAQFDGPIVEIGRCSAGRPNCSLASSRRRRN